MATSGTAEYEIVGMTCGHCSASVAKALGELAHVTGAEVDHATGRATVTFDGPLDDADIARAVTEAGYSLQS